MKFRRLSLDICEVVVASLLGETVIYGVYADLRNRSFFMMRPACYTTWPQ